MLRDRLNEALKDAVKSKAARRVSTLRLILAALKDRDIAARGKGADEPISDDDILSMLQTMVRQRRESIAAYEQGGRLELAEQEREEIGIIQEFMPLALDQAETRAAVDEAIAALEAGGLKDMGKVMGTLKSKYAGRMDFGAASTIVKERLV